MKTQLHIWLLASRTETGSSSLSSACSKDATSTRQGLKQTFNEFLVNRGASREDVGWRDLVERLEACEGLVFGVRLVQSRC